MVLTLAVTSSLVFLGPKIGDTLSNYFICRLVSSGHCGRNSAALPVSPTVSQSPPPPAFDIILGPSNSDAEAAAVDALNAEIGDQRFSDYVHQMVLDNPVDVPAPDFGPWADYDATVTYGPNGTEINIPGGQDVANTPYWVAQAVGGSAGVATSLVVLVTCTAVTLTMPGSGIFCPALSGFFGTFIWNMLATHMTGGSLGDPELWKGALVAGVEGAIGGALAGYLIPVINGAMAQIMTGIADRLLVIMNGLTTWWTRGLQVPMRQVIEMFANIAPDAASQIAANAGGAGVVALSKSKQKAATTE